MDFFAIRNKDIINVRLCRSIDNVVACGGHEYVVDSQWDDDADFVEFLSKAGCWIVSEDELLPNPKPFASQQPAGGYRSSFLMYAGKGAVCSICGVDLSLDLIQNVHVRCSKCGKELCLCSECKSKYLHKCKDGQAGLFQSDFDRKPCMLVF